MASMREKVLDLAKRQVGYKETGDNVTKYARFFDVEAWQWFNTKKNGVPGAAGGWCAILLCWLTAQNETLGQKEALKFLGCPAPKNNCAAGVPYLWEYLVKKGYKVDKKAGVPGDFIFFNAKCTHVGIIEKVDKDKYYTIEGNKSNMVKRSSYGRGSSSIYGICHMPWDKYDKVEAPKEEKPVESAPVVTEPVTTPEPAPAPVLVPTPAPAPKPATPAKQTWKYQVICKKGLNVRINAGKQFRKVGAVNYGDKVTILEKKNGFGKLGANRWVSLDPNYMKLVK